MKNYLRYFTVIVLYIPVVLLYWLFGSACGIYFVVGVPVLIGDVFLNLINWLKHEKTDWQDFNNTVNFMKEIIKRPFRFWHEVVSNI